jgi:release factor glutamine methyltransferase
MCMAGEQGKNWTIRDLMKVSIDHFQKKGIEHARLNVELLLAHALSLPRIQLYVNFDKPLTPSELAQFRTLFERRLNREPVQYIIGSAGFMGLTFKVDPRVLIPRPETETLIEQAILFSQHTDANQPIEILEIGTGSGNIAVSLAKFIKRSHITTLDISKDALQLAKENATIYGVEHQIDFFLMDVMEDVSGILKPSYDLIVSNPPYIARDEWEELQPEVRQFEPAAALTDNGDGLQFYRRIAELAPKYLHEDGSVLLEVGFEQAQQVTVMFRESGFSHLSIINDLQEIPRVVCATRRANDTSQFPLN